MDISSDANPHQVLFKAARNYVSTKLKLDDNRCFKIGDQLRMEWYKPGASLKYRLGVLY